MNLPGIIDEVKFHFPVMDNILKKLLGDIILNIYSDKKRTHHLLTFNSISETLIYNCLLSSWNLSICKISFWNILSADEIIECFLERKKLQIFWVHSIGSKLPHGLMISILYCFAFKCPGSYFKITLFRSSHDAFDISVLSIRNAAFYEPMKISCLVKFQMGIFPKFNLHVLNC